jgi:hypothetical protein
MSTVGLGNMEVSELVDRFADICLAQDEALADGDASKFNRLFDEMQYVVAELKSRPGDQRSAILSLYNHPNMQVRIKAAKNTLAVAPREARKALEEIAKSQEHPQALEAGMSLWNLERGIFKPT